MKANKIQDEQALPTSVVHINETSVLLNLAVAQIQSLLTDSDKSLNSLTGGFTNMITHIKEISNTLNQLPGNSETGNIHSHCEAVEHKINQSVMDFQFYDIMTQRLNHLILTLNQINDLINSTDQDNQSAWIELQQGLRSRYISEEDKKLFDNIVLKESDYNSARSDDSAPPNNHDIELF